MSNNVSLDSDQGKQQVDALMAKMTPEQQEEFRVALAGDKPVQVRIAQDGSITLGGEATPTPEASVAPKVELPKPTKLELKRRQIIQERIQRHMGKGLTEQQAVQAIQQEDFDAMPLDKKFSKLEDYVLRGLQDLANNITNIQQNQEIIASACDTNFQAIHKLFEKLGIPHVEQQAFLVEARKEVTEARQRMRKAQLEAIEQKKVELGVTTRTASLVVPDVNVDGAELPKEATIFGG